MFGRQKLRFYNLAAENRTSFSSAVDEYGTGCCGAECRSDLIKRFRYGAAIAGLFQAQGALRAEIARLADLFLTNSLSGLAGLDALIARGALGLRLLSGWKVVIAGRPNAGKSRLLNALCGFHRAIVEQGTNTTRDVVAFGPFGGWPVELSDTAGLRARQQMRSSSLPCNERGKNSARLILCCWSSTGRRACSRSATDGGR